MELNVYCSIVPMLFQKLKKVLLVELMSHTRLIFILIYSICIKMGLINIIVMLMIIIIRSTMIVLFTEQNVLKGKNEKIEVIKTSNLSVYITFLIFLKTTFEYLVIYLSGPVQSLFCIFHDFVPCVMCL